MPVPPTAIPVPTSPDGPRAPTSSRRITILGVAIDDLCVDEAIAALSDACRDDGSRTIFFANAHTLNHAAEAADYRDLLNQADLVLGDGTGVRWAARLQGLRVKANLNGTDLIPAFMSATDGLGLRYYLLGATPAVVERTATVCAARFPGWTLAGFHDGHFEAGQTDAVIAAINAADPDMLLVAMGNPLQERWIHTHRARLSAKLCIGVGGLFAYLSGDYTRAPLWIRRLGFEWLAVSLMQPHKFMRYLRGNPLFLWRIIGERRGRRA